MSFGIAKDIKSEVRVCTPDLLNQVLDAPLVARTCAEIEDALEKCRRGELTRDEYETLKGALKKRLPILTFHATFKNGRRKNDEAIPSGLSIYDLDHIANPQSRWAEIEPRKEELGIMLTHITPSTEGLRLVFIRPNGMSLAEAQAWMARQLGDTQYDACVKDYARCSFLVPREYVLYQSEELFNEELTACSVILSDAKDDICRVEILQLSFIIYQLSFMMKRGIRNNNPLNIRHSADRWQGAKINQTDKSFVQFESMAYGYRAAWKVLDTYWLRFEKERKPYTVRNIIGRWAPPDENNTESYIRTVTRLCGLGGNENVPRPLRFWCFGELEKTARLIAAMTCVECGIGMDKVDMDAIWEGYDLAFPAAKRRQMTRNSTIRSNRPLMMEPQPIPKPLEQVFHHWDEYWDWSPQTYRS